MAKMALSPIYQRPRTSDSQPEHRIYQCLLRDLAIMAWVGRKVLAWRLSTTMDAEFCVAAPQ